MKLIYKYYGFESGLMALKHNSLGFNTPSQFNDPMEGRLWLHQMGVELGFFDSLLENFGILCLTQDPLNLLMWSHYGQSHTGFVIGYDVNEPILGHQEDSIFDISDGQVFFSPELSSTNVLDEARAALHSAAFGMEGPRCNRLNQTLRHIFLMKHECWRYEREIRVVKLLYNLGKEQHEWMAETGNNFQMLSTPIAPIQSRLNSGLSLLSVAQNSIRRIILGMKNPLLKSSAAISNDEHFSYINEGQVAKVDQTTWSSDGQSLEAVEAVIPTWENLNSVSTKYLTHNELEAILRKRSLADTSQKQGLTVTKFLDGRVEAFWDQEL